MDKNIVDIVMPVHIASENRVQLLVQTLNSLLQNTEFEYVNSVSLVDDFSPVQISFSSPTIKVFRNESQKGAGWSRNFGIAQNHAPIIYLSDGDVYFTEGWLGKMLTAFEECKNWDTAMPKIAILAGGTHRYSGTNSVLTSKGITYHVKDAVSTWSWMLDRGIYDEIGKIMDNATGPAASEDVEYCTRLRNDGFIVAGLWPEVVYHTGITGSDGRISVGYETFPKVPDHPEVKFL